MSHSKVCIQFGILLLSARCEQHRLDLQRLAPSRFCILWSQHSRSHSPRAGCLYSIWNHSCVEQRKNKVDSNWIKELSIEWVFYLANLNWMLELKWFISSRKLIVGRDYAVHHQNRLTCQRMQFETKWAAEFKESTGSNSSHGTFGVSTVLVSYWLQSTVLDIPCNRYNCTDVARYHRWLYYDQGFALQANSRQNKWQSCL